ncbi:MAG: cobalamin B12-binding domain-containing protein [Firmicutes bacterium]|nr:cobalamin B12-binding domain-containing protein [Bacillota bacterium]
MQMDKPIRVLIAKIGLDGHDRGAKVIVQALREAGMDVVYTGLRQTPQTIVNLALEQNVQVIGLSSLSGAHMYLFPPVVELLRMRGANDVLVIAGGVISIHDIAYLKEAGISGIFTSGASTVEIVNYIKERV